MITIDVDEMWMQRSAIWLTRTFVIDGLIWFENIKYTWPI